ncbi:metalloendopeptidase [Plakobranchus ocellatus]|uniref:Metalloendopeptidase n=1 Tax=Plakobranchus ocellatus TaxID=259542 RepID=A0AAV4D3Z0_9GAST|nr:metalloendopeptidase [Plakobranchus ocellatus]
MENRGRQEVSIGPGCEFRGIIMHELLHTLGFYHEHSRFDRDESVSIDLTNVDSGSTINFDKMDAFEISLQNTPYDFDSIMSYDPYTLAVDGSRPVMVPLPGKADAVFQMGQRLWLSNLDVLRIQRLYGCQEDTTHVSRPERDNSILACNFQSGLCNMNSGFDDFHWVVQNGASSAGPAAGHSTGIDNYLVATAAGNTGKSATIISPIASNGGACIDFYLFLKDDSSNLVIEASGPDFMATKLPFTPSASAYGRWTRYQKKIDLPVGIDFQISFKAVIGTADVAIDDLRMYTGSCN